MLYLIGAGGHAAVIEDMLTKNKFFVNGVFYDGNIKNLTNSSKVGNFCDLSNYISDNKFILAFGDIKNRIRIVDNLGDDVIWQKVIDPTAIISSDVIIGEGTVVMPGAIINAGAKIGKHVIINSGVVIEHGCIIEDHVHVAPGSVICGNTKVGMGSFIGAGTVVINAIKIGKMAVVGAGSVIINNIEDDAKVVGVPAKKIVKKK